jgi:hypothetical protein
MAHEPIGIALKGEGVSTLAQEARPSDFAVDPSIHFIVEPPRRPTRFRSWFALAVVVGILMALAIVAITT